jgi:hypothetical protein
MRKYVDYGLGVGLVLSLLLPVREKALPVGQSGGITQGVAAATDRPIPDDVRLKGVKKLTRVAQLTGEESINRTGRFGVAGTDLGSMVELDGKVYLAFGDTFGPRPVTQKGGGGENWRSNVMAVTADTSPSDGITFETMILGSDGKAQELIPSKKDRSEITVIPTGGCSVGGKLYWSFMSVRKWGVRGVWESNYGGLARSDDRGQTWTKIEGVRWPSDSHFTQAALVEKDGEVCFWSTPAGRFGAARLMKVAATSIEEMDRYVFYAGMTDGNPVWSPRMKDSVDVVPAPVGELSLLWNKGLERWYMTYLNERSKGIEIREARNPWGPWSDPVVLVSETEYPILYGAFMHPRYVEEGGRVIYFAMSQWIPYNVFWMRAELDIE